MSRIGKAPIYFDKTVQVTITPANEVVVKGAKQTMTVKMRPEVTAKIEDNAIVLTRANDGAAGFHGLYRALIQNAVTGVTKGWKKELELNGVGYRAAVSGRKLELTLGFSHPVVFNIPAGVDITVEKLTKVVINCANRDLLGQVAAKVRGFRPPEPYLGKGIKYSDEVIRRKAGKSAAK